MSTPAQDGFRWTASRAPRVAPATRRRAAPRAAAFPQGRGLPSCAQLEAPSTSLGRRSEVTAKVLDTVARKRRARRRRRARGRPSIERPGEAPATTTARPGRPPRQRRLHPREAAAGLADHRRQRRLPSASRDVERRAAPGGRRGWPTTATRPRPPPPSASGARRGLDEDGDAARATRRATGLELANGSRHPQAAAARGAGGAAAAARRPYRPKSTGAAMLDAIEDILNLETTLEAAPRML